MFAVLFGMALALSVNAQQTSGYAQVNGLKMYYETHGSGGTIPLVLIHGGGSTIESSFGNLLPLLSAHRTVIAMELQAHGRTSDRDAPESFRQDADDVAALLAYLKVSKADFLGFSNGGETTLQIALSHPELVHKIVMVSAPLQRDGFIPGFFEGIPKATLKDMPVLLREAYLKVAPDKSHLEVMFEKDRDRMIGFKGWSDDDIRSIKVPAMVMVSDHDVVTPEHAVRISRLMPDARLVVMPGVHGSVIGESGAGPDGPKTAEATAILVGMFFGE